MHIRDQVYISLAGGVALGFGLLLLAAGMYIGKHYNNPKSNTVHPQAARYGMYACLVLAIAIAIIAVESQSYRDSQDNYTPPARYQRYDDLDEAPTTSTFDTLEVPASQP